MNYNALLSVLTILLLLGLSAGAVGTVSASPADSIGDVQYQQETPTDEDVPEIVQLARNNTTLGDGEQQLELRIEQANEANLTREQAELVQSYLIDQFDLDPEADLGIEVDITDDTTSTATSTSSGDFAGSSDSSSSDSGVTVQVQVGDSSNSNNSTQNNSSATEAPFNTSKAEHEFNNGILLNERNHNQTTAVFTLYNPTEEPHWVVTNNNDGQTPRIKSYELEPGEAKTLKTPTTGNLLSWTVSVTSTDSIQEIQTGAQYNVQYSALVINWNPAGDLGPLIGIVGALLIITLFVAVMKLNMRVGKIAIPLAGQSLRNIYQDEDLPNREDPYSKQAKDLIHGWGLLAVVGFNWAIGVLAFWDIYPIAFFWKLVSGFGRLYDPATLVTLSEVYSNLMVYWAYDTLLFTAIVWMIGRYYLKRNGYYLHDNDPVVGDLDYAPWLLSPSRFADLRVFKRLSKSESSPTKIVEIDKKRLKEINRSVARKSFVVSQYAPKKNIAFITMEDVDPSALARAEKKFEVAEFYRSIAKAIQDDVWGLVKRQARKLQAESTARLEGELMEGAEQRDEWMHEELAESEYEEVATGEKSLEQELLEQKGEVEGLTDSVSNSNQSSQTAGENA